jgi:hypothetical protein
MNRAILMALLIAPLLFAGSSFMEMQNAYAVPITIDDPSFESQTLVDGAFTSGGPDTFWVFDPSTGYFNPTASHLTPEAFDVENTAYSNGGEICQELGAITTNTLYALSVYVADRKDTAFPGYDIELRDASDESVLASIDETTGNPPADDAWAENTLELTILNGNASIGNNLKICLSSDGTQTNFDLVSLDATSINLPIGGTVGSMGTVSLLVAGAQVNMGWWIIAVVGTFVGVGIAYKVKTNKTNKETL